VSMCVPCVHVCACGCVDNAWTGTLCANTPSATCLPPVSSLGLAYASQRGGELEVRKKADCTRDCRAHRAAQLHCDPKG
jgi:hypothetical protein